jgi:ADP-ribose pyrophosphatase
MILYRASGLEQRGPVGGIGGEDIAVHRIQRNAVAGWLKQKDNEGVLIDVKVWAGLWWLALAHS